MRKWHKNLNDHLNTGGRPGPPVPLARLSLIARMRASGCHVAGQHQGNPKDATSAAQGCYKGLYRAQ